MKNKPLPKNHFFKPLLLGLGLMLSLPASNAIASQLNHNEALKLSQAGKIMPAQELLGQALATKPDAHLLSMALVERKGKYYYRMRLLTPNKKVHHLVYQAGTGKLIKDVSRITAKRQPSRQEQQHYHHYHYYQPAHQYQRPPHRPDSRPHHKPNNQPQELHPSQHPYQSKPYQELAPSQHPYQQHQQSRPQHPSKHDDARIHSERRWQKSEEANFSRPERRMPAAAETVAPIEVKAPAAE